MSLILGRRQLIAGGVGLLVPGVAAAAPSRLAFQVFRNGTKIGEHQMTFAGTDGNETVSTDVDMVVKVGPVPVYKYKHSAVERWSGGRFVSIDATTNGNGKIQKTSARALPGLVQITGPKGVVKGPADAVPLSHWNQASFGKPLFNQQEAKMLKVVCTKVKPGQWSIRGEAEIDDFYDGSGNWMALKGKLEDGSKMEYRRI
ncbi:DUF6134 family protein [Phenylobacterium sp.]|uniref:DUF6134 family protein n=1 Tax=Phenylobacterium sp. TaxID=1871053 RepID=UPI0026015A4B|nr:DUF6134 family protein [Phenylobacterium sp.]